MFPAISDNYITDSFNHFTQKSGLKIITKDIGHSPDEFAIAFFAFLDFDSVVAASTAKPTATVRLVVGARVTLPARDAQVT